MKSRFGRILRFTLWIVGVIVLLFLSAVGGLWFWYDREVSAPLPSDASLTQNFYEHRIDIERLRKMAVHDNLIRIAPTFTRLQNDWSWPRTDVGISQPRWDLYRELFRKVGSDTGIDYDNPYFVLTEASRGFISAGSSKGYIYTPTLPSPVVSTLDEFPRGANYDIRLYEHLTGNWYIFLERGG
jgi:hypothetical protein